MNRQADAKTCQESYSALLYRVEGAETVELLRRLDAAATNVYINGCLTTDQLRKIDTKIMEKIAEIETR
jgi:hypothetical protein